MIEEEHNLIKKNLLVEEGDAATPEVEWRSIPNNAGYEVSACGKVRSYWRMVGQGRGRAPKFEIGPAPVELSTPLCNGYPVVNLGRNNKHSVHRLVLLAFVGQAPIGYEARHLDGNSENSRLENLRWGSPIENQEDQYRHGTRVAGERHAQAKLSSVQVVEIRSLYATGKYRQKALGAQFGVCQPTISAIVNRKLRVTAKEER